MSNFIKFLILNLLCSSQFTNQSYAGEIHVGGYPGAKGVYTDVYPPRLTKLKGWISFSEPERHALSSIDREDYSFLGYWRPYTVINTPSLFLRANDKCDFVDIDKVRANIIDLEYEFPNPFNPFDDTSLSKEMSFAERQYVSVLNEYLELYNSKIYEHLITLGEVECDS